jgi:hypothetical protein
MDDEAGKKTVRSLIEIAEAEGEEEEGDPVGAVGVVEGGENGGGDDDGQP